MWKTSALYLSIVIFATYNNKLDFKMKTYQSQTIAAINEMSQLYNEKCQEAERVLKTENNEDLLSAKVSEMNVLVHRFEALEKYRDALNCLTVLGDVFSIVPKLKADEKYRGLICTVPLLKTHMYYKLDDLEGAIACFKEYLSLMKNADKDYLAVLYLECARLYQITENRPKAKYHLELARKHASKDTIRCFDDTALDLPSEVIAFGGHLGDLFMRGGNYLAANLYSLIRMEIYSDLFKNVQYDSRIHYQLARVYKDVCETQIGLRDLKKAEDVAHSGIETSQLLTRSCPDSQLVRECLSDAYLCLCQVYLVGNKPKLLIEPGEKAYKLIQEGRGAEDMSSDDIHTLCTLAITLGDTFDQLGDGAQAIDYYLGAVKWRKSLVKNRGLLSELATDIDSRILRASKKYSL